MQLFLIHFANYLIPPTGGFVDIVDSIDGTQVDPMSFKAELYKVLKKDPDKTLSTFKNYKYPNIKPDQIEPFLSEILLMINEEIADDAKKFRINPILLALRSLFVKAKSQKELVLFKEKPLMSGLENLFSFIDKRY